MQPFWVKYSPDLILPSPALASTTLRLLVNFALRARQINPHAARDLDQLLKEAGILNVKQNYVSIPSANALYFSCFQFMGSMLTLRFL